jgi:hypothetical protein
MRFWLVIAGFLVVALLVAASQQLGQRPTTTAAAADEPHAPRPGHLETLPAAVALTYARGMQVHDENIACYTMTADAARAVGCGTAHTHLRTCGAFSIRRTRIIRFRTGRATVEVGVCRIELVDGKADWAVSRVDPA